MTANYTHAARLSRTRATEAATGQKWCAKGVHFAPATDCKRIVVGNGREQWICSHHAEMAGR